MEKIKYKDLSNFLKVAIIWSIISFSFNIIFFIIGVIGAAISEIL